MMQSLLTVRKKGKISMIMKIKGINSLQKKNKDFFK